MFFTLANGNKIPSIGFGTFPMKSSELKNATHYGLKIGYRLFDTSTAYGNEKDLGKALKKQGLNPFTKLSRDKYFITTKLFLDDCRKGTERKALETSLDKLKTNYVDFYLLHWADPDCFIDNWKKMEKLYEEGLAKNIGVCNFEVHHFEKLSTKANIMPQLNQIELHPLLTQNKVCDYCSKNNILIQSYSPFARMDKKVVENPTLLSIAKKYNRNVTQIILKWNIQEGRSVVAKSSSYDRLKDNFNINDFLLSKSDINAINNLNEDYRVRHHPDIYPVSTYPRRTI